MLDERSADDEVASHGANYFQQGFNMTHVVEFPQSIQQVLLEQNHGKNASTNTKHVILLDSQPVHNGFILQPSSSHRSAWGTFQDDSP